MGASSISRAIYPRSINNNFNRRDWIRSGIIAHNFERYKANYQKINYQKKEIILIRVYAG